jgi:ankyrin repeat protein
VSVMGSLFLCYDIIGGRTCPVSKGGVEMINEVFKSIHSGDEKHLHEILDANPTFANMENNDGLTPLGYAAHYGKTNVVKLLLDYGANVDAVSHSRISYIPSNTALHAAIAGERSIEVIATLLKFKAQTHILDSNGQTCLHTAAFHDDNVEIINLLIEHGADVNTKSEDGRTPLAFAIENGNHRVAEFLSFKR